MKKKTQNEKKTRKKALRQLVKAAQEDSQMALDLTQEGNHRVLDEEEMSELSQRASKKTVRFD